MTKAKNSRVSAAIFALVLIINPNINIIDIFPDFIGYLILLYLIKDAVCSVPYFPEAKTYLTRLTWLSVLRLPAFLIMMAVRGENTADSDIIVLLTFVFAVAEVLLLIFAISNLFGGLFYLGERVEARGIISPYKLGKGTQSPESLRSFAYIFAIAKAALNFLPETLRLTKTVTIGSTVYVQYMSKIYPFVLISAIILSAVIGIIFIKRASGYIKAIGYVGEGELSFRSAALIMYELNKDEADKKKKIGRLSLAIGFLTVGSIFSLEIILDNFHGVNILPHFIYGALISAGAVLAARELNGGVRLSRLSLIFGSAFGIVSVFAFSASVSFLSKYSYQDLLLGDFARAEYFPVIILSLLELILLIALLFTAANINHSFILSHTGLSPKAPSYNTADRDFHRSFIRRGYILYSIAALAGIAKFVQVLLNFKVEIIFTSQAEDAEAIITNIAPWWGTVVTGLALVYIVYSFIYYASVREEVEFKNQ